MKHLFVNTTLKRTDSCFLLFYLLLILIQFVWAIREVEISDNNRLLFSAIVFSPSIIRPSWLPFTFVLFVGTSINSFICLVPSSLIYALVLAIITGFIHHRRFGYTPLIWLSIYFLIICVCYSNMDSEFVMMVFIILISSAFIRNNDDLMILFIAFVLLSIYLSLIFIVMRDQYAVRFAGTDIERGGWTNPNGFGAYIACGVVLAYGYLMKFFNIKENILLRYVSIVTIVVSLIALALNASRGAFLSAILGIVLFSLFSKTKLKLKFVVPVILICLFLLLDSSGYFELLEYRMNDEGSGGTLSYRTVIWQKKITSFMNLDFISQAFGIGLIDLKKLGIVYSTHNDFITAIIGFGFVGMFLFFVFIFYPLYKAHKLSYSSTIILTLFLIAECFVIEPFFRGMLVFYYMYLFLYKNNTVPEINNK